ncbi:transmembrane protein [Citrus sinensis]|nr:transmembrane protein [Citrus sinensis]
MERENSTFGFIEELKEPLIGKEETLEPLGRSSEDSSSGWVSQVVRAPTRKDFETEKNKSISIDLVGERKELIIHVDENLEPQSECCIYRVPRALRKKNKEAYTPTAISIGPLHHDRACLANAVRLDLQLLENQLPFFVLDGLHKLASPYLDPENDDRSFIALSCEFFRDCKAGEEINDKAEDILHFTHLSRYFKTRKYPKKSPEPEEEKRDLPCAAKLQGSAVQGDLPCAAKLQGSGVQFKGIIEEASLLDINFKERKRLGIPCLKVAELQIPRIEVDDCTESLMRNLMALEQCHYPRETIVCNYVDFMDTLINTDEDVDKLAEAGIISNSLGGSARIAKMFNDLCLEITLDGSNYAGTIEKLKNHYVDSWNHAKATLKRTYFSNLWKGTGTVAALLLLVFNLIQAIWSIISAFS